GKHRQNIAFSCRKSPAQKPRFHAKNYVEAFFPRLHTFAPTHDASHRCNCIAELRKASGLEN
ncbi:MAG: hypothetical protein ACTTKL_10615, partial [Treponema sp.]